MSPRYKELYKRIWEKNNLRIRPPVKEKEKAKGDIFCKFPFWKSQDLLRQEAPWILRGKGEKEELKGANNKDRSDINLKELSRKDIQENMKRAFLSLERREAFQRNL